jgi:hypothetical protein
MKFLHFMQWRFKQMTFWDWAWWVAFSSLFGSFVAPNPVDLWMSGFAFVVFISGAMAIVWEIQRSTWNRYNDEQQKIVDILKDEKHG